MTASGRREQMEYLDSDKAGTNGAPRPRTGRNICEVCERALARTDTGMCDFCTVCHTVIGDLHAIGMDTERITLGEMGGERV